MSKKYHNTQLIPTEVTTNNSPILIDENLAQKFEQAKARSINLDDFVKDFLGNFLSEQTKRAYVKDLEIFFQFLQSGNVTISHPKEIEAFHFQYYRDFMIEQKLSPATINRRLVCIRSFLKWALAKKMIDHNPLDAVKLPKVRTESPTIAFDDQEVCQMVDAPDITTRSGNVHRIILVLLFNLGLRRSELAHIKKNDIFSDRGHWILRVVGKGEKERLVPLPTFILQELQNYEERLSTLAKIKLSHDDYLIQVRPKGMNTKAVDGSTIFRIVSRYAEQSGILKRVGPHSCRATVISHLLDTKHVPIRDVAIFAGHSNITTTERYDKRRKGLDDNAVYKVNFEIKKEL